jgi:cell division protein FtsB
MSWEQRNHDFSTAQVDAQMAYIEAEREVKRLQDENAELKAENAHLWESVQNAEHEESVAWGEWK